MNNVRFLFVFFSSFILAFIGQSQQYVIKSYTVDDGLPTRTVNDVCQDNTGYLWFATQSGISSYDGFCFKNYDASSGLPVQQFLNVKNDENGIIWGVPRQIAGIIVYLKNNTWNKIIPAYQTSPNETNAFDLLYMAGNPVLCMGSGVGLDIYQNGRWNHVNVSGNEVNNQIWSVTAKSGKFYALTRAGIFEVELQKTGWKVKEYLKPEGGAVVAFKFERPGQPDEKLWILTPNRLTYLQNGKSTLVSADFALPTPFNPGESFVNFDNRGNVFFGNSWAKYYVNRASGKVGPLMVNNGFSSNGASSVFVDREQNVWFTDTRGVDKVSSLLLMNYFEFNGLLENEVTAILELKEGGFVFGHNGGLTTLDQNKFTRIEFPGAKNNQLRVMDLMQDDRGDVWIAASILGFGKMIGNGKIKWYKADSLSLATTIHQGGQGKIWAGTSQKLYYLKNDRFVPFEKNQEISSPFRKLFSSNNGELIGAGLYGFYKISGVKVTRVLFDESFTPGSFYAYYQDKSGTEYVGTLNGLGIIENGRIRKYNRDGIRIDSPVYFIFQDKKENYWIGSNNGVYIWDGKKKLESCSVANGLAGRETNRSAGVLDKDGNVLIGTDMGLSCFIPGHIEMSANIPIVQLIDCEDNKGDLHNLANDCSIGYNDNNLYFHFKGISFTNEEMINYRYKLEGLDHEWQYVNQSGIDKVKYSLLDHGKYQFVVQARNGSGEWSEVKKSGIITIQTPFYSAWWFHLITVLIICLVLFGFVKIIIQAKYSKRLEIEIAERKRSEQKALETLESLHQSEMKYHDLIEFAVDGILIGSKEGVIINANSYMQKLTGRTRENLIGINVKQLFTNSNLDHIPLRYDLLENGELVVSHRDILREDGTHIPVEMHTKMMPDGSYQSIYHDITKRREAEENLRESRELFKLISDKMTDVVWLMDLKGKSTFVSPSIEQFTGYCMEEYLGQSFDNRFTKDSANLAKNLFKIEMPKLWAQQETLVGYSHTLLLEYNCKNGGSKWGELLMTPFFGVNGDWLGIHGVTRDVTDRKHTEEALQEKASELARFNSLMVGRELKMVELKKEINEMLVKTGKPEKYIIHE